jgi:hypothetical protein
MNVQFIAIMHTGYIHSVSDGDLVIVWRVEKSDYSILRGRRFGECKWNISIDSRYIRPFILTSSYVIATIKLSNQFGFGWCRRIRVNIFNNKKAIKNRKYKPFLEEHKISKLGFLGWAIISVQFLIDRVPSCYIWGILGLWPGYGHWWPAHPSTRAQNWDSWIGPSSVCNFWSIEYHHAIVLIFRDFVLNLAQATGPSEDRDPHKNHLQAETFPKSAHGAKSVQ